VLNDKGGRSAGSRHRPVTGSDRALTRELHSYRDVCGEIDRLLSEGRLLEATRLNEQARMLFRRLQGSVGVGADRFGEVDGLLAGSVP
jgi:hypothetical protein